MKDYIRRSGGLHPEEWKIISGGVDDYIRRSGGLYPEESRIISGGVEDYIRRCGRFYPEEWRIFHFFHFSSLFYFLEIEFSYIIKEYHIMFINIVLIR